MNVSLAQVGRGLLAGFVATIVLSILMLMKNAMGLMPNLDIIAMLSTMMNSSAAMAWVAHFMIGTVVWGGLFALVGRALPGGTYLLKGIVLGIGAWLLMMIMIMPMAGAGVFGLRLGMAAPVMTLVLHIIFGAVLGATYGALEGSQPRKVPARSH